MEVVSMFFGSFSPLEGGPLVVIHGVITPYKWPEKNGKLGLFHHYK